MVDAEDLKSFGSNTVRVRVPPWAPLSRKMLLQHWSTNLLEIEIFVFRHLTRKERT